MKRGFLIAAIIFFSFFLRAYSQNVSNEGTNFWAVFPTHVPSQNNLAQLAVFVTSKFNTEVTVSCGSYSQMKAIPANTAVQFDIPRANAHIEDAESNQLLSNRGIHIKVTDGMPKVSAYAHIFGRARSAASLILPFETLGQTYYSMNYTQTPGGKNYMVLMAVEDNTSILIHEKDGGVIPITLDRAGDVYEYMSGSSDLTGVYAETDPAKSSCKRFSAFSGSSTISIGCLTSLDPLYQQLYPTVSWGRNYGVVPIKDRRCIIRIVAQENNTKVTYNGLTFTLNKGEYHESGFITLSTFITADKLISVAQFSLTQACSSASGGTVIGDPEMVILNPVEFSIKSVTVFSSDLESIAVKYINVLIRTNKASTFKINNITPSVTWTPLVGNSTYSYAQIQVFDKSLTLTADDGFNATAYGFGSVESYAYSAGTNLSSNNYLTVVNEVRNEESPNGCIGQALDFKINLPYQPDRIIWTLDGGVPEVVNNPVPEVKNNNGQTIYVYSYPVKKTYTVTGEYHLEVVAHVPASATNCTTGDLTTNYVFNIFELPVADFKAQLNSCAESEVLFTDNSDPKTSEFSITDWFWDFKDGTTSAEEAPKHQFKEEGIYKVALFVKAGTGCYSEVVEKEIEIYPLPVSNFFAPKETCVNTEFDLKDLSTISNNLSVNSIKAWRWEFGDGTPASNEQNPKHTYSKAGTYTIKLVTTSSRDCVSKEKTFDIVVTELPTANFTLPDICLTDAVATFTNTAKDVSGGTAGLTYLWDFGDRYLSGANLSKNTSTDVNGVHTYTVADNYQVKLTITNANGCVAFIQKTFTVNGSVPKANFEVIAGNTLCSSAAVSIKNTSIVDFGKVVKIEVYKDLLNEPENFQTFEYPIPDQIDLVYTPFGLPATKDFQVKIVAYSGSKCVDFIVKTVTVEASPSLVADEILPVCQNDGTVQLNQFRETSGIPGTDLYTSDGAGMGQSGIFNPKAAGVGTHTITYTFNADNGCTASITKTILVNQSPIVDAGTVVYMLAGGEVTIPAVAEGNGLSYQWTPSISLSSDKVLNPIASPDQDTQYTLTVTTNPDGCQAVSTVMVKVLEVLNPPNTFTPNGDNFNDVWNIKYLDTYPNATVEIFNRNGNRVFYSNGYKNPFDGNFQNEPLPVGVYYYIIDPKNGRKKVTGPLTIIR
ncbi:PKD domain-containing protein [Pedobacter sandarakinus]|uniref:PKD domain-containing protein n=1 Tax=Pedobacter sandarakinus TaxID=353156 RepID=UPI002AFEF8E4|nr:PKD domain-containing protein [Pedobacter sandarakinus]